MARQVEFTAEGGIRIRFYGIPGVQYVVQRTRSLTNPQWEVISGVLTPGPDGSMMFVDPNPPAGSAYYRLMQYVEVQGP